MRTSKAKADKEHPFFCIKKQCRKTAWDTPEYLNESDWQTVADIIAMVDARGADPLYAYLILYRELRFYRFFNQSIGWPEGWHYCYDRQYFDGMGKHVFGREIEYLRRALKYHHMTEQERAAYDAIPRHTYCELLNSDGRSEGVLGAIPAMSLDDWTSHVEEADGVHGAYEQAGDDEDRDPGLVWYAKKTDQAHFIAEFISRSYGYNCFVVPSEVEAEAEAHCT